MHKKAVIKISGTVQGVGFRPFVYRMAEALGIRGHVKNLGEAGVEIAAEGSEHQVREFVEAIEKYPPANAKIDDVAIEWTDATEKSGRFRIIPSGGSGAQGAIPADYGICDECIGEAADARNRRYGYPLISCTSCGPRFAVLEKLPLDRRNTSYGNFPPCRDCSEEYRDPKNRRFHAQNIACQRCGPDYFLLDDKSREIQNPIASAIKKLIEGKILAIKGASGMHLACLTKKDSAVATLRKRRKREQQPFAIMSTLSMARRFAEISGKEERLLMSVEKPIVVLRKSRDYDLSELVSPGLANIGVMLPYTALHHLLFQEIDEPLIMTSANLHGEPMVVDNDEILRQKAADYFLLHDLEIINRCDDSVIKAVNDKPVFIRRSRGYVPRPVGLKNPEDKTVLALGAGENVTFCLLKGNQAFLSQHIGNAEKLASLSFMEDALERFLRLMPAKIDAIACDLHPGFNTTKIAADLGRKYDAPVTKVQHHHAHLLSLAGEHNLEKMVGICCDGVGYGLDGKSWGGEVFALKDGKIMRRGHLKEQPMPGGDLAAHYPARMAAGILFKVYNKEALEKILSDLCFRHKRKEIQVVIKQLEKNVNVQQTSSTGRVLDAAAAVLGVCPYRTYEGEPAMKLEAAGWKGKDLHFPVEIKDNVIDTSALLRQVVEARKKHSVRDIACSLEKALARGLAEVAIKAARKERIRAIGVSGGVAYNDVFVRTVASEASRAGLGFYQNVRVPCGDGGVSYGQAAYAARELSGSPARP